MTELILISHDLVCHGKYNEELTITTKAMSNSLSGHMTFKLIPIKTTGADPGSQLTEIVPSIGGGKSCQIFGS